MAWFRKLAESPLFLLAGLGFFSVGAYQFWNVCIVNHLGNAGRLRMTSQFPFVLYDAQGGANLGA